MADELKLWRKRDRDGGEATKLEFMKNERKLLAELRRHNLLKPLIQRQIIAEAVRDEQVTPEELETARNQFMMDNGLNSDDALRAYLVNQGIHTDDFEWQVALPIRINKHCKKFEHKAEAHFLNRKNQLDQVVYSLLRTKDPFLAQELYLRIDGKESNFGDLASQYSEGPERGTKGIVGPVPLTQAHPTVAEVLRTSKPGVLMHPIKVNDWWIVLRLESYKPASFDAAMAERLSQELFDQWVNEDLARKMAQNNKPGVATTAE